MATLAYHYLAIRLPMQADFLEHAVLQDTQPQTGPAQTEAAQTEPTPTEPVTGSTRRSAGRPTREQAEARFEELLDTALDLFLKNGFELTTIDMIAQAMNMTKRTVYAKFDDKSALFLAAVERAIARQIVPPATLQALDQGDVAQTLEAIARLRINQVLTPNGMRLQHIIQSESYRFPQIAPLNFERSAKPVMEFVAALLDRAMDAGTIARTDSTQAASAFMSMVVGGQVRTIIGGHISSHKDIDERVRFTVHLLLNGLLPR